ncbi:MAG: sugar kinase [Gammaproteobacteria bacterium]|jgi:NAD kinase
MARPANQPVNNRGRSYEKVVIVTRKTELEELTARFNSVPQARFYLEHAGQDFSSIAEAHQRYHELLEAIRESIPGRLKNQVIERGFLPQFRFGDADLVVTIGPDGLVVNTAKYLDGQPILPVNPDPAHIDGILLPFDASNFTRAFERSLDRAMPIKSVTMAESTLNDGQSLLGFNDLFIGARSHVSARYDIALDDRQEFQSSSGIIVSTGAGSTGWLQSVYSGASSIVRALGGHVIEPAEGGRLPWDTDHLVYAVREPFPSKITGTEITFGVIDRNHPLTITSRMTDNGVIFSDGIEADFLAFNSGATATIGIANRQARILYAENYP